MSVGPLASRAASSARIVSSESAARAGETPAISAEAKSAALQMQRINAVRIGRCAPVGPLLASARAPGAARSRRGEKHHLQQRLLFSEVDARRAGWRQVGMAL